MKITIDKQENEKYEVNFELTEHETTDQAKAFNGINIAIDMYLRKGHIGKTAEQQLLEDRELRNFTMVLSKLIENDAFCKEMIVVEMES